MPCLRESGLWDLRRHGSGGRKGMYKLQDADQDPWEGDLDWWDWMDALI